jgi:hypothetical protein
VALKERRATRRFLMRLPLTVRWTDESVVGEAATESREVSSRGLYFHLPKGLRSGAPVEIRVHAQRRICRVKVSYPDPAEMGEKSRVARVPQPKPPAIFLRLHFVAISIAAKGASNLTEI